MNIDNKPAVLTAGLNACCVVLLSVGGLFAGTENAAADVQLGERFRGYGDFRVRVEQDWNSLKGDGTKRDDRLRLRYRIRGGIEATIDDNFSVVVAARSGPDDSQQFPHTTIIDFDGGDSGPYEFNLDHWYLQYQNGGLKAWVGRNEFSFWHQDELFVYDNVTYPGVGLSYDHKLGKADLTWNFNAVALPVGMKAASGHGVLGQVVYHRNFTKRGFTLAAGFFGMKADPDNTEGQRLLLTENNTRDYSIVDLEVQYRSEIFGKPYYVGVDYTRNLENYDNEPVGSFSEFHKNDLDGYVAEVVWGDRGDGDFQFGYYYAYLEALTVNSSYIADDWVRWGNSVQIRATNLKGSEFRLRYTIKQNMNIISRLFFVDAIDLLEPGDTTKETGDRLRIDFNISF